MITGARYILWQRRAGLLAMVLLMAALLSLADALVGGLKGSKGLVELIPGDSFAISGPMPPRTEEIQNFVIDGVPADGSVRLIPKTIFSGFWFGGAMWRGVIEISPEAREGRHVLSITDRFGEKQNSALVFTVQVWPSIEARNANSPSLLTKTTGHSPFVFALLFTAGGLAAGGTNFLFGRLWARHLARQRCGEIFKLRQTDQGTEVTCELIPDGTIRPGMDCTIFRPTGEALCQARVSLLGDNEVVVLAARPGIVRLGDVACLSPSVAGDKEPSDPDERPSKPWKMN